MQIHAAIKRNTSRSPARMKRVFGSHIGPTEKPLLAGAANDHHIRGKRSAVRSAAAARKSTQVWGEHFIRIIKCALPPASKCDAITMQMRSSSLHLHTNVRARSCFCCLEHRMRKTRTRNKHETDTLRLIAHVRTDTIGPVSTKSGRKWRTMISMIESPSRVSHTSLACANP